MDGSKQVSRKTTARFLAHWQTHSNQKWPEANVEHPDTSHIDHKIEAIRTIIVNTLTIADRRALARHMVLIRQHREEILLASS